MKKHYIGMCGLQGGYMPNCCDVYESRTAAAESLGSIYDLSDYKIKMLRKEGYLEVGEKSEYDGMQHEYCSIEECICTEPWIHSDNMNEKEYREEYA